MAQIKNYILIFGILVCFIFTSCKDNTPDPILPLTPTQKDSIALININTSNVKWNLASTMDSWKGVVIDVVDGHRRVVYLDLHNSQLSGKISTAVTNLTSLAYLDLSDNLLTENIPNLSALTRLQILDLHKNNLSGILPENLTSLKNLTYLSLGQNFFYGDVPEKISQLDKLIVLDLAEQKNSISNPGFSGNIPSSWSALINLKYVYLHKNAFSGRIPQYFSSFKKLIELTMDNNNLMGQIPTGLGDIASLEFLSMKQNSLTGAVPTDLMLNPHWEQWENQIIEQQGGNLTSASAQKNLMKSATAIHFGECKIKHNLPDKKYFYYKR